MSYLKEKLKEQLVLEPEDWSNEEWKTICKLFNKNNVLCERIIVRVDTLESFTNGCCGVCECCEHKGNSIEGINHLYGNKYYSCMLRLE